MNRTATTVTLNWQPLAESYERSGRLPLDLAQIPDANLLVRISNIEL